MAGGIKKQKKIRYSKVTFKLSLKQKNLFLLCCQLINTSPNKYLRSAIGELIRQKADALKSDPAALKNQLSLFNPYDNTGEQLEIDLDLLDAEDEEEVTEEEET